MEKHSAWAAAISSSGLVPFSFSNLVLKEYGVSASTPDSVETLPPPSRPLPRQTALALRIMRCLPAVGLTVDRLRRSHAPSRDALDVTRWDLGPTTRWENYRRLEDTRPRRGT